MTWGWSFGVRRFFFCDWGLETIERNPGFRMPAIRKVLAT